MKIENFETKFSVEDVVYFMMGNELCKGVVESVQVSIEESASLAWSNITQAIIYKIESFLHLHKQSINVRYSVLRVKEDGTFYSAYGGYFTDSDLTHTKEELYKILESNMI